MFTTTKTTAFERQLGLIPPNYDQYLILFTTNKYAPEGYQYKDSIEVWNKNEWTKQSLVNTCSYIFETHWLRDWVLVGDKNNAPDHVYVPKGMKLIIDAIYTDIYGVLVRKPIEFIGNDHAVSIHDLIQYHNKDEDYFYLGFDLESPETVNYSFAWANDNF